jgi:ribonuclease HI
MKIYCDGGTIGRNPSKIGGTWAWCKVVITPEDADTANITNNFTELYAAIRALESENTKKVSLFTDSNITKLRLTTSNKFANIPKWMINRAKELRKIGNYEVTLLGGHPTKKELITGRKKKNGLPVSKFNCLCDEECNKLAKIFQGMVSNNNETKR